jgi:acetyltransferase-like isoleucine patch superfamily enzyme
LGVSIEASADVASGAVIGDGSYVWHLAQVREGAVLGEQCIVGRGAYIGVGVELGDRCKVQNYALIYEPARLGSGVFVGPGAILTNDMHPRAVTTTGELKSPHDWSLAAVVVGEGASIGAGAVCVAPVTIGRWSMVAAGAIVTRDVPDHALVAGCPAKPIGWVGRSGKPLIEDERREWRCPESGERFREGDDGLHLVTEGSE